MVIILSEFKKFCHLQMQGFVFCWARFFGGVMFFFRKQLLLTKLKKNYLNNFYVIKRCQNPINKFKTDFRDYEIRIK